MEQSTTGEAANMEIALLLGLTGERAPERLGSRLPALRPQMIEMLGQRDANYLVRARGVQRLEQKVLVVSIDRADPAAAERRWRARSARRRAWGARTSPPGGSVSNEPIA
jgi:hypothetical protein